MDGPVSRAVMTLTDATSGNLFDCSNKLGKLSNLSALK
jgi:hypothetical protein